MNFLVIDGNSILNRAFYGIKILTTKDGRFTNAIYGFMNIFLRLKEECSPDAIAVAFDVKAPTFRHEMYGGYKATRKGMPEELAQQLPVVKELLIAMGVTVVEKPGYEADDILGTLAKHSGEDVCTIATGDRDSLQLVSDSVNVLLASTKMGRPVTERYTPAAVFEKYGVEPVKLIDIKALMGDNSDNIPGVAGIGEKTAGTLVSSFGTIEDIYEKIDEIDVRPAVREKLKADKDMAFLSKKLGTINCDIPIEKNTSNYVLKKPDNFKVTKMLADLEMFKLIDRLGLEIADVSRSEQEEIKAVPVCEENDISLLMTRIKADGESYFIWDEENCWFDFSDKVVFVRCEKEDFYPFFIKMLEDKKIKKYTADIKKLYSFAAACGSKAESLCGDIQLSGYVLNPSSTSYDVLRLAGEYSAVIPVEEEADGARSAACLRKLFAAMNEKIAQNGQEHLLNDIELPLARVLASMERIGFAVDSDGIARFGEQLGEKIEEIESEIYQLASYEFNLNSPKQLGEALFEKLGLPAKKKTKSGYSTDAKVLESLADKHPVVRDILEYRTLSKLKSTYCDGLLKVIGEDGRIHSTLNQTETRTGRISSTEPNLQNIPVRSPLGREMRRFFVAAPGCVLVDADYSQIELRVLAHISGDKHMTEAFNNNTDIHTVTASEVFDMPPQLVTPLMRSRAKAVNFGIVYGIGAFSLAKDIGVTRAQADEYIKGYLGHYSGVNEYMERVVKNAKDTGYAETIFARRRYLPELTASNAMTRAFGERVARNMPIQGTAADIIKVAMIKVYNTLKERNLAARLIMQVHDELIVEAPENEVAEVAEILKNEMENAVNLSVALTADVHSGKTWYEAKE
ncbi:MAG: DNA polymerase I [Clostridia bacterium]|nr:DNA polymerase I [Clostridia bacterium]